jgi:maltose alpha-D-glucosyltransferase/alpha-amylase
VLALSYERQGRRVIVLHNFSREPQSVRLRLRGRGCDVLADLIRPEELRNDAGAHSVRLEAYGYRWYRVGGLTYATS